VDTKNSRYLLNIRIEYTLNNQIDYGFCFVDGCPVSPEQTQQLLERIAFIRVTHYGGFYDFTSDLTLKDTAYTSQALQAHTDTTYFSDPVGLQMFHLLSHTSGSGGKSLLVDGLRASRILYEESKAAFKMLSKTRIQWHASGNEGIVIVPVTPEPVLKLLEHGWNSNSPLQVRWNNDDRGALSLRRDNQGIEVEVEEWYDAARLWNDILKREDCEYWEQLVPGRALIFDNWRVLHGRSKFTGKRRMCGGYINRDDFMSRWRTTNFKKEDLLRGII